MKTIESGQIDRRAFLAAGAGAVSALALGEHAFGAETSATATASASLERRWTAAGGKFEIEASLVAATPDRVALRKKDGNLAYPEMLQLSVEDRDHLKERFKSTPEQRILIEPLRVGIYQILDAKGPNVSQVMWQTWLNELNKTAPGWWVRQQGNHGIAEKPRRGSILFLEKPARVVCWANTEVHRWIQEDFKDRLLEMKIHNNQKLPSTISKWLNTLEKDMQCHFQAKSVREIAATVSKLLAVPVEFHEERIAGKKISLEAPIDLITSPGHTVFSVLEELGRQCGGGWGYSKDQKAIILGTDPRAIENVLTATHQVPPGMTIDQLMEIARTAVKESLYNSAVSSDSRCKIAENLKSITITTTPFLHQDILNTIAHCAELNKVQERKDMRTAEREARR